MINFKLLCNNNFVLFFHKIAVKNLIITVFWYIISNIPTKVSLRIYISKVL